MKVTSNLSFLLCIGILAKPVVEASLNGFGRKHSAASTKRSIQRQVVFDFAAQQSHRDLQLTDAELEAAGLALCEAFLVALLGPNSGCTCTDDEPSMECSDFVSSNCLFCDTLQFEEACLFLDEEAQLAATSGTDSFVDCLTYESGPFTDKTICGIENFVDNTCAITIDGEECTSCTVVACGDEGETNFDIDCSNIIAEETWNLCTDDIPETSLFIAVGDNDRFEDLSCDDGNVDLAPVAASKSPSSAPSFAPSSMASATSSSALSTSSAPSSAPTSSHAPTSYGMPSDQPLLLPSTVPTCTGKGKGGGSKKSSSRQRGRTSQDTDAETAVKAGKGGKGSKGGKGGKRGSCNDDEEEDK
jgi:hypothetical protein